MRFHSTSGRCGETARNRFENERVGSCQSAKASIPRGRSFPASQLRIASVLQMRLRLQAGDSLIEAAKVALDVVVVHRQLAWCAHRDNRHLVDCAEAKSGLER